MSNPPTHFVPDAFSGEAGASPRTFVLDEFVRDAEALRAGFIHDLENQRNLDPANVLKAKEGVKEIFAGAMQQMKEQAEKIQEEAREKGYEDGHEEGYQTGAQAVRLEYETCLGTLKTLIEELGRIREQAYPRLEREMVEMVATLARKVIRQTIAGREDGIREIVRMAVGQVMERKALVIRVHPEDYRQLQDFGEELVRMFQDIQSVRFEAHGGVARGHCVVQTNFGTLEAGLDHLDETINQILHLAPPPPPPEAPWEEEESVLAESDADTTEAVEEDPEAFAEPEIEPAAEPDIDETPDVEAGPAPEETELLLDLEPPPEPEPEMEEAPQDFEVFEEPGDYAPDTDYPEETLQEDAGAVESFESPDVEIVAGETVLEELEEQTGPFESLESADTEIFPEETVIEELEPEEPEILLEEEAPEIYETAEEEPKFGIGEIFAEPPVAEEAEERPSIDRLDLGEDESDENDFPLGEDDDPFEEDTDESPDNGEEP